MRDQKKKPRKEDIWKRLLSRIRELAQLSEVLQRIAPFPLLFLTAYYFVQFNYQYDTNLLCPGEKDEDDDEEDFTKECHKMLEDSFEDWFKNYRLFTKVLTFLLGLYGGNIIRRWWSKVGFKTIKTPQ